MSNPSDPRSASLGARGLSVLREAIEQVRPAERRAAPRIEREDVRAAVLTALVEQPMSGYQIVRALEERGGGVRTPGAGAVYPTLQLLVDQGLAAAAETDGGKTYSLTEAGRAAATAAAARERAVPVAAPGIRMPERRGAILRAGAQIVQAASVVAQTGSAAQIAEAVGVLDEARRRLYSILARN